MRGSGEGAVWSGMEEAGEVVVKGSGIGSAGVERRNAAGPGNIDRG